MSPLATFLHHLGKGPGVLGCWRFHLGASKAQDNRKGNSHAQLWPALLPSDPADPQEQLQPSLMCLENVLLLWGWSYSTCPSGAGRLPVSSGIDNARVPCQDWRTHRRHVMQAGEPLIRQLGAPGNIHLPVSAPLCPKQLPVALRSVVPIFHCGLHNRVLLFPGCLWPPASL